MSGEDQVHILEAFLEEAMTSGTSRLSSVAPSVRSGIYLFSFGKRTQLHSWVRYSREIQFIFWNLTEFKKKIPMYNLLFLGWPSRIESSRLSSSQSNLPSLINSISGNDQTIRHKARQVPLGVNYYPPRPQRTSFNSRRS